MTGTVVRILGIDPGLNFTGYGIVDSNLNGCTRVASGVIKVPEGELSDRLGYIFKELSEIIQTHSPQFSAIEKTFLEHQCSVKYVTFSCQRRRHVCSCGDGHSVL